MTKLNQLKLEQKFTYPAFKAVLKVTHKTNKTVTFEDSLGREKTVRGKATTNYVNLPNDSGYRQ